MHNPFFSIIIPTYNRAGFLKPCLESVLSQDDPDFELVIIDDGSTDQTAAIIAGLGDQRVKYLRQENKGPASARNLGLTQARSKFICFLDSDDRFRQNKLAVTRQFIQKHPEYKIFHTEEIWYRDGRLLPQKNAHKKPSGWVFENAANICSISISTAAIHREVFNAVAGFDEAFPACEDYDFWLRATAKFPIFLIPEVLTIKEGGHPDQQSKKYVAMDRFRIQALLKILESGGLTGEQRRIAGLSLQAKCRIMALGARNRGSRENALYYERLSQNVAPTN